MKRWMLMTVVVVSALALMATPALAADQTRSQDRLQDGSCADCTAECDQTQTQTQARDCDGTQAQAGTATQTQAQVKAQAGTATQTQAQVKAQAGTATPAQTQVKAGDQEQPHTPEWVRKLARFQKQFAKCVHAITSSD